MAVVALPNAAPEWQARTLERKQGIGGGLSTQGACSKAKLLLALVTDLLMNNINHHKIVA